MAKKSYKVVIPDEVLSQLPEEEREEIREHVKSLFENFDPDNPPGQIVEAIGITDPCPECGGPLRQEHTVKTPEGLQEFVECEPCQRLYRREATN